MTFPILLAQHIHSMFVSVSCVVVGGGLLLFVCICLFVLLAALPPPKKKKKKQKKKKKKKFYFKMGNFEMKSAMDIVVVKNKLHSWILYRRSTPHNKCWNRPN